LINVDLPDLMAPITAIRIISSEILLRDAATDVFPCESNAWGDAPGRLPVLFSRESIC
jgi:hypothetical protein